MLQNAHSLAKIGADTAENEQHFAEILPIGRRVASRAPVARASHGSSHTARATAFQHIFWDSASIAVVSTKSLEMFSRHSGESPRIFVWRIWRSKNYIWTGQHWTSEGNISALTKIDMLHQSIGLVDKFSVVHLARWISLASIVTWNVTETCFLNARLLNFLARTPS